MQIQNARRQRFSQNGYVRTHVRRRVRRKFGTRRATRRSRGGWRRNSNKHNKHNILLVPQPWRALAAGSCVPTAPHDGGWGGGGGGRGLGDPTAANPTAGCLAHTQHALPLTHAAVWSEVRAPNAAWLVACGCAKHQWPRKPLCLIIFDIQPPEACGVAASCSCSCSAACCPRTCTSVSCSCADAAPTVFTLYSSCRCLSVQPDLSTRLSAVPDGRSGGGALGLDAAAGYAAGAVAVATDKSRNFCCSTSDN